VERAITPQTKAIVAMHYAGLPCDMAALLDIGERHGIPVLEDDAHAIGTFWQGKAAGTLGEAGCFSFYANKNFTTIEGGMLTTARDDFASRARALRLQGMTRDAWRRDEAASWRYDIVEAGFKYPMNDVSAAIGLVQLGKLPEWQKRRERIAKHYREALHGIPGLRLPAEASAGDVHGNHLFVVRIDREIVGRDRLGLALRDAGIETSVHFVPLHLQPYFQKTWGCREGQFPVAERAFDQILSLPMHGGMADYDALLVANEIRSVLAAG
jgi:dTDP-4-amino-4,6-dideoxygalactose transaminase